MIGYHFTNGTLRDGSPLPPVGQWLKYDGPVVPCESGLHASASVLDALQYAPGNTLHLVELLGDPLQSHGCPIDKFVGNRRRIFRSIDCERLLRQFARQCAMDVIDLRDAPQIVRDYLQSGDEHIRAAAWGAAWDAARDKQRERLGAMVRLELISEG